MSNFLGTNMLELGIKSEWRPILEKVNKEELYQFMQNITTKKILKGETYINIGSKFNKIGYISQGIMMSVYQKKELEITGGFFTEGSMVCAYNTLLSEKPSGYRVVALEDTTIFEIDNNLLRTIFSKNASLSEWGRDLLKAEFSKVIDRMESHFLDSPEERYIKLLHENREIFLRVSQKYIASYLGITAVSLSRIRARVLKRN